MLIAKFLAFVLLLSGTASGAAGTSRAAASVSARKGPLELIFKLYSTRVKRKESLWYQLELKNVGKKRIAIDDKIFRDPWAIYENIRNEFGIYLEVVGPPGRYQDVIIPKKGSPPLRSNPGRVQYAYEPKPGETKALPPEVVRELDAKQAEWRRRGMSDVEQKRALEDWWQQWNYRMRAREDMDRGNDILLEPGASTRTIVWSYRETPEEAEGISSPSPRGWAAPGFTELWAYNLYYPGKYKIRAVYDHLGSGGKSPEPADIRFETRFIPFEVLP